MPPKKLGDQPGALLEENLKKALTEMILLHLLSQKDSYIGELTDTIQQRSNGALSIVFPYGAIYRLEEAGHIYEVEKRNAPDGRRRQYFRITESGRAYLAQLMSVYRRFFQAMDSLLAEREDES